MIQLWNKFKNIFYRTAGSVIDKEQLLRNLAKQSPVFQAVPDDLLRRLSGSIREFAAKTVIFSVGEAPEYVYLVLSGEVEISLPDQEKKSNIIVKIQQGQFFGELGVLKKANRAGTAMTRTAAKLLVIDSNIFYDAYWSIPRLQKLIKTMQRVYRTPHRGTVTSDLVTMENLDAVRTTYVFERRTVVAYHVIDKNIFSMSQLDEQKNLTTFRFEKDGNLIREISLADHVLVSITNMEEWDQLGYACHLLLDRRHVEPWQVELFQKTGNLDYKASELHSASETLCFCMNINYGLMNNAVKSGLTEIAKLSAATGAGSVCGACRYKINELLVQGAWSSADIDQVVPLTPEIRLYRFKLHDNKIPVYEAGQHIMVQALIEKSWVERPYTLISLAEEEDYYEILVKKEGYFSQWLFGHDHQKPVIRLSQPQGKFTFNLTAKEPCIFLAGGIGIAPAIAFVRSLIKNHAERRFHIDYSAYYSKDFVFYQELSETAKKYGNFSVCFRVTSEEGILTEEDIADMIKQFPDAQYYVCGHEAYKTNIMNLLKSQNIADNKITAEVFSYIPLSSAPKKF